MTSSNKHVKLVYLDIPFRVSSNIGAFLLTCPKALHIVLLWPVLLYYKLLVVEYLLLS